MNPHDFVKKNMNEQGSELLLDHLRKYYSSMQNPDSFRSLEMRSFAKAFIMGLIQNLGNGRNQEISSAYLRVWEDCGYFGIDRTAEPKE